MSVCRVLYDSLQLSTILRLSIRLLRSRVARPTRSPDSSSIVAGSTTRNLFWETAGWFDGYRFDASVMKRARIDVDNRAPPFYSIVSRAIVRVSGLWNLLEIPARLLLGSLWLLGLRYSSDYKVTRTLDANFSRGDFYFTLKWILVGHCLFSSCFVSWLSHVGPCIIELIADHRSVLCFGFFDVVFVRSISTEFWNEVSVSCRRCR